MKKTSYSPDAETNNSICATAASFKVPLSHSTVNHVSHLTPSMHTQHTCSCAHVLSHIHKQTSVPKLLTTRMCLCLCVQCVPCQAGASSAGKRRIERTVSGKALHLGLPLCPVTVSTQLETTHLPWPKKKDSRLHYCLKLDAAKMFKYFH